MIASCTTMIVTCWRYDKNGILECRKNVRNLHQNSIEMVTKYFNIIPGEGSATLLLYGDIGDGYKVESGRIVSELIALQSQYGR